jgi:hypothetical protein
MDVGGSSTFKGTVYATSGIFSGDVYAKNLCVFPEI